MTLALVRDETPEPVEQWATRIRSHLTKAVEGIVAAGRDLIEAKAEVGHGNWLPLLEQIGISKQVAARWMSIGRNPVLSKVPNSVLLPRSTDALYELSRAGPEVIEAGIASGQINPSMTIKQAKALVQGERPTPEPIPEGTRSQIPLTKINKLCRVINDLSFDLTNLPELTGAPEEILLTESLKTLTKSIRKVSR